MQKSEKMRVSETFFCPGPVFSDSNKKNNFYYTIKYYTSLSR